MGTLRSGEVTTRLGARASDGSIQRVLLIDDDPSAGAVKEMIEDGDSPFLCEIRPVGDGVDSFSSDSFDAFVVGHTGESPPIEIVNDLVASVPGPVLLYTDAGHHAADRLIRETGAADCLIRDQMVAGTVQRALSVSVETWRSRRQTEDELRHYRDLAAATYDGSSVSKAIVSLEEGRVVSANQALHDFLGYENGELSGVHFADITHPEDIDADVLQFQRLVDREVDSYTIDKRYIRADGSLVWGRLTVSVFGGHDGPVHALGQVVDITDRKRAEDHVAFQASLFQQMRTPVVATDLHGLVTHWNEQAELAYGWSAAEAIGQDFTSMVLPEIDEAQLAQMRADMRHGGLWEGELVLTRRDGSTFPAWTSGAVVRDARGRPAGIVGSIVDLSDVQKARQEASTQEMLSRSLLDAVSVPIAVLGADGEIVACNPSWGMRPERPLQSYLPDAIDLDPESELLRELVDGVDSVLAGEAERFVLEYPSGSAEEKIWTRVVAIPVEHGGAIVCHWDITDERFARVALEETLQAKDEFITSISHELRTPLSVVVGLSETLRMGEYEASEKNEFHDLIADQAQEMALIVEDLLVAGRIDSQTLTVRSSMVDVEDEVAAAIRPWQQSGELDIGVKLRPGTEKVYADSLRVRQILRNLVTNAARYGEPPIEIKAVRARGQVILSVSDHGEGVPEQALDRMFQPYARFGAIEGQPSSVGLGLHVARRLARLMSGDLVYKRDADLTTFILYLPAESPEQGGQASAGLHLLE